jgi:hypothetical protein
MQENERPPEKLLKEIDETRKKMSRALAEHVDIKEISTVALVTSLVDILCTTIALVSENQAQRSQITLECIRLLSSTYSSEPK